MQQGDVWLYQTPDDGDITVEHGQIVMTAGLETAVYISLFGGNEGDPGLTDTSRTWWGNQGVTDPAQLVRAQTQHLCDTLSPRPSNLLRMESAVRADLQWLLDGPTPYATDVAAVATIPALNTVKLRITVTRPTGPVTFDITEDWRPL